MLSIVAFGAALAIGVSGAAFAQTAAPAPQDFDKPALLNTNSLAVKKSSTRSSQGIDPLADDEDEAVAAFQRAADAILRRAPNTLASAATHELPISGKVPLPKKRPIARP